MSNGFVQMPLKSFVSEFPKILKQEPFCFIVPLLLAEDPERYFVRFNNEQIEFGFIGDNWTIS